MSRRIQPSLELQRRNAAYFFLAPTLLVMLAIAAWPLAQSIYFSFTNTSLSNLSSGTWVGFDNYLTWKTLPSGRTIFRGTLADADWWNAVWNTVRFALVSVTIETVLGLMIALFLDKSFRGRGLLRAAILIPWVIPTIVSAQMWAWMLNDQFGVINDILLNMGLIEKKIAWTATSETAMLAVLMVDVWKTTPFMALLCLAALQMVPRDIYEAAYLDGISKTKVFFKVTLPLIRPALMVAVIFRMLDALRIFDLVYVLTPKSEATETMSTLSRQNLIDFDRFALGSAQSTLLFLTIMIFVVLYIWIGRVNLTGNSQ